MKTFLCIVARTSSKRLPKKALLNIFKDINLLDLLISRLSTEFDPNRIVLATTKLKEDDILEDITNTHNIKFFRGSEKNVLDRLINSCMMFNNCENIVRITGDNPLTDPKVLKKMIIDHEINISDYTFTQSIPVGTRAEVLSLKFLKYLSKNVINKDNTEYMTYYFQKELGQINKKFDIDFKKILSGDNLTVDTIEDLQYLKNIFKELEYKIDASLDEIITTINSKNIVKHKSHLSNKFIDLNDFNLKDTNYE
tara:strand:+ start:74585 stop:75343 length:759 start_codon:yes stop_codon:yes gene_type:complete